MYDVNRIRADFPDPVAAGERQSRWSISMNGASAQKPQAALMW